MPWPKGRPNKKWRKRFYTWADYTPQNVEMWKLSRVPYGLRADLAQLTPLKVKGYEYLRFTLSLSKTDKFVVASARGKLSKHTGWFGNIYFTPGYLISTKYPEWRRGKGFTINKLTATFIRLGVEKLLNCNARDYEENNGFYLYEITLPTSRIRFFIQRVRRTWHYYIREFRENPLDGMLVKTSRCVTFPTKNKEGLEAIRSFCCLVETSIGDHLLPGKTSETVNL